MGKNILHCGDAGSGGVTKLCNNLALAISMIGTSEAMALVRQYTHRLFYLLTISFAQGISLGMDPNRLAEVMNTSTARQALLYICICCLIADYAQVLELRDVQSRARSAAEPIYPF